MLGTNALAYFGGAEEKNLNQRAIFTNKNKGPLNGSTSFNQQTFCRQTMEQRTLKIVHNGTAHIRYQCSKTTVLSCHICLIKTGVKNEQHWNIGYNFDPQMSLSKSKCLYSNNCLQFLKRVVPLFEYQHLLLLRDIWWVKF